MFCASNFLSKTRIFPHLTVLISGVSRSVISIETVSVLQIMENGGYQENEGEVDQDKAQEKKQIDGAIVVNGTPQLVFESFDEPDGGLEKNLSLKGDEELPSKRSQLKPSDSEKEAEKDVPEKATLKKKRISFNPVETHLSADDSIEENIVQQPVLKRYQ